MAKEPDDLVVRLLREIRAKQDAQGETLGAHGGALARLEKRVEDLYTVSTHTLGVAGLQRQRHPHRGESKHRRGTAFMDGSALT